VKQRDHEHTDRLALLPLEREKTRAPQSARRSNTEHR
jgi:hypothetical protein